jgi:PBSX family phage terminase large subunit
MKDNLSLTKTIRERYERMYSGVFYARYILGLWTKAEGLIYKQFADDPNRYIVDKAEGIVSANIGVDFGGGTSAHAFSCVGFTRGHEQMVILDEYREKEAMTPEKLCDAFVDFVKRCRRRWLVTDAYCDSAEQTLINGLRVAAVKAGLPINVLNARKRPINDRIRAFCILLGSDRVKILRPCKETIAALQTAVWNAKKPTEDVRLDDGSTNIDSLDAMEYAFEQEIGTLIDVGMRL